MMMMKVIKPYFLYTVKWFSSDLVQNKTVRGKKLAEWNE